MISQRGIDHDLARLISPGSKFGFYFAKRLTGYVAENPDQPQLGRWSARLLFWVPWDKFQRWRGASPLVYIAGDRDVDVIEVASRRTRVVTYC